MSYVILILALVLEVTGTSFLKLSNGFSNVLVGCSAYALYGISIWMFSLALRSIPLAIADTIWQGSGIVLICLTLALIFGEHLSSIQYAFIGLTMIGVIGLGLVS